MQEATFESEAVQPVVSKVLFVLTNNWDLAREFVADFIEENSDKDSLPLILEGTEVDLQIHQMNLFAPDVTFVYAYSQEYLQNFISRLTELFLVGIVLLTYDFSGDLLGASTLFPNLLPASSQEAGTVEHNESEVETTAEILATTKKLMFDYIYG